MRLARSVRQLSWVSTGLCLYAPLTVRIWAYNQTSAMEISTENLSNIGKWHICTCFRYCESATNRTSIGRPISAQVAIWDIKYIIRKDKSKLSVLTTWWLSKEIVLVRSFTTGNPLSKRPIPTSATTGTIPSGLKNLQQWHQNNILRFLSSVRRLLPYPITFPESDAHFSNWEPKVDHQRPSASINNSE